MDFIEFDLAIVSLNWYASHGLSLNKRTVGPSEASERRLYRNATNGGFGIRADDYEYEYGSLGLLFQFRYSITPMTKEAEVNTVHDVC